MKSRRGAVVVLIHRNFTDSSLHRCAPSSYIKRRSVSILLVLGWISGDVPSECTFRRKLFRLFTDSRGKQCRTCHLQLQKACSAVEQVPLAVAAAVGTNSVPTTMMMSVARPRKTSLIPLLRACFHFTTNSIVHRVWNHDLVVGDSKSR